MSPRSQEQGAGPEALKSATGRDHVAWRALLSAAGALDWPHPRIARYLVDEHGIDPWWAQGITVDFEQTCRGRRPGQRADGTFAVTRTKTIAGERLDALAIVEEAVSARHGEPHGRNLAASQPNVRWRLPDGTRLHAAAAAPNKSGTPVTLTWEKLPDADAAEHARADLDALFDAAAGESSG